MAPNSIIAWLKSPGFSTVMNCSEMAVKCFRAVLDAMFVLSSYTRLSTRYTFPSTTGTGTLKAMLQRMISRGATIFLTSHVLEIVERLCSHVAIIHEGRLVAQGSIAGLRAGVEAGNPEGNHKEKLTLEQIFLSIVGGARPDLEELSWLG